MTNARLVRAEFLADGGSCLTGDVRWNFFIRDSVTGNVIENYPGTSGEVPIAVSPDGRFIARRNAPVIDRPVRGPEIVPAESSRTRDSVRTVNGC